MKELKNMVIVEETINTGFINEHGKVVTSSKTKRKAMGKEYAEKVIKTDETIKIIGPAYEVIRKIGCKTIRQVLTLEEAESIESVKTNQTVIDFNPQKEEVKKPEKEKKEKEIKPKKEKVEKPKEEKE
jgi:hypothetical protein